jgi:hypothetical protein
VVDWPAALRAGLIAATLFFLLNLILLPATIGLSAGSVLRYTSSVILGKGILPPPDSFHFGAFLVALIVHFALSLLAGGLIAYVIHRGGLVTGILGGALLGLTFYAINVYTFSLFRPWMFVLSGWTFALNHILFGAVAGGVYEALEVEIFVPAET